MRRHAFFLVAVMLTVPVFGQYRSVWRSAGDIVEGVSGSVVGTVVDVDEGHNQLTLSADEDRYGQITVATDSVSTQYNGFGDVINGKPEIFTGSKGFANVRQGDRLEIRGVGKAAGVVRADQITLLGRSVAAPQTGVGETRSPSGGISTPTVGSTATVYGRVEGVVRQVNASDNRIVVETDRREIFNIRTSSNTPVYYRNDTYQVGNLEVGDRIRVESDGNASSDREIRARSIEVLQSVQEGGGARVSSVTGRVTSIDRTADVARVDTGRGEVRVDMSRAYDATGRRVRAADLQVGDRVDISGSYGSSSDVFMASTVRFNEDVFSPPRDTQATGEYPTEFATVTISGTVTESLQTAANLAIKDRTGRTISLYVTEDFAVRTKSGGYTTAEKLNVNDNVLVKAFRDSAGNYIAQTIRMR
ncbi:MAG TPA: hypothetical protein VGK31_06365 [Thermoanaerobaculia bacterium]|jgi:hypothetical protein